MFGEQRILLGKMSDQFNLVCRRLNGVYNELASISSRDAPSRRRLQEVNSCDFKNCACVCLKIGALCDDDALIFVKITAASLLFSFFQQKFYFPQRQQLFSVYNVCIICYSEFFPSFSKAGHRFRYTYGVCDQFS